VANGEVSFEVRDTAEEAVVAKDARVVEEVAVGKEASDRTETISDSVRRTDVDVETVEDEETTATRNSEKRSAR
jgi:stress response protein YsnF